MRVLHVVPSYLPARRYGGPVFATHAMCTALARMGCDVTVFTTNVDGPSVSDVPLGRAVDMDGVKVWYFEAVFPRRICFAPTMKQRLEQDCASFDLLHLHSVYLWPTWAAARTARRVRTPYLLAPRGMLVQDLIARKSRWVKRGWISLIERQNIERAAGIHVTSATEATELLRFGFALPKVYEVPHGVASDEAGEPRLPAQAADLFRRGCPVVLSLGRINWKKGLDRLVRAMTKVREAALLIAGNDEEVYSPKLRALAEREGVADRVVFIEPVFGAAKSALYRRASVFVLPSYSENFGNVVLEAMHEGCPVVVTPEVGAAGIVDASGGGLIAAGTPDALAMAINQLLTDPAKRDSMGRKGRDHVRSAYSWDSVAQRMQAVYREAIANGARRGT